MLDECHELQPHWRSGNHAMNALAIAPFRPERENWFYLSGSKDMKGSICVSLLLLAMSAQAADIVRYPLPDGNKFPIASAVEVPAGTTLIFQSGTTPSPKDASAPAGTPAYWGDTKTQALSAFANIKKALEGEGVGFGDVVKMLVFLVGDPANDGKLDFKGFMEAYTQYFGTADQPNLPARSAVQVAALAAPGVLVEIEVILAKKPAMKASKKGH
jgi:enamine deaminase RidA (YjgF/YER057c/UK114 family)